jgi:hypothetical protein
VAKPEEITDKRIRGLIDSLLAGVAAAPKGERHYALLRLGRTFGGYMPHIIPYSVEQAREALVGALPPEDQDESARKTADDAVRKGMEEPLYLEERPNPFAKKKPAEPEPQADPEQPTSETAENDNEPAATGDQPEPKKKKRQQSQDSLATQFTIQHRNKLRFCHHSGMWHVWNGAIWKPEETQLAFDYARTICRDVGGTRLATAKDATAVERFARADRTFAVTSELWDRDKYLLGTPGAQSICEPANYGQHSNATTSPIPPQSHRLTKPTASCGSSSWTTSPARTPNCAIFSSVGSATA